MEIGGWGSNAGQGPRPGISLSRRRLINRETMTSDTFIATQRRVLPPFEKCQTNPPSLFSFPSRFLLQSGSWGLLQLIPAVKGEGGTTSWTRRLYITVTNIPLATFTDNWTCDRTLFVSRVYNKKSKSLDGAQTDTIRRWDLIVQWT